ncbi:MAG: methyltransferase family protein [Henriciella sp.]
MAETLADIRFAMAIILIVILPVVTCFWLVIHGAIGVWKQRPNWQAYTAALVAILITLAAILPNSRTIIGADLGHSLMLFGAGAVIYVSSFRLSSVVRRHLSFRTFAGIPEVADEDSELIDSGPFEIIRHPRYLMVTISTLGWAMMCNFAGVYMVSLLFLGALLLIIRMEERELIARFGDAYRHYQDRVPMLVPAPSKLGRLFV